MARGEGKPARRSGRVQPRGNVAVAVRRNRTVLLVLCAAVVAVVVGYFAYRAQANLPGVQLPDQGNLHIASADSPHVPYNSDPPTSGPHLPYIAPWGVHTRPIVRELQVHNLEDSGVLVRGVTPPGAPYDVKVPTERRKEIMTALAPTRRTMLAQTAGTTRASGASKVHVVRPRETINSIAKRYGVSAGEVLRMNSLEKHDSIRPGDRLRIAGTAR